MGWNEEEVEQGYARHTSKQLQLFELSPFLSPCEVVVAASCNHIILEKAYGFRWWKLLRAGVDPSGCERIQKDPHNTMVTFVIEDCRLCLPCSLIEATWACLKVEDQSKTTKSVFLRSLPSSLSQNMLPWFHTNYAYQVVVGGGSGHRY